MPRNVHTDVCTKVGLYILLGSSMFCLGVLVGFDLKCLKPREKLSPENPMRLNHKPMTRLRVEPVPEESIS